MSPRLVSSEGRRTPTSSRYPLLKTTFGKCFLRDGSVKKRQGETGREWCQKGAKVLGAESQTVRKTLGTEGAMD